jgi:hypothetical protein
MLDMAIGGLFEKGRSVNDARMLLTIRERSSLRPTIRNNYGAVNSNHSPLSTNLSASNRFKSERSFSIHFSFKIETVGGGYPQRL